MVVVLVWCILEPWSKHTNTYHHLGCWIDTSNVVSSFNVMVDLHDHYDSFSHLFNVRPEMWRMPWNSPKPTVRTAWKSPGLCGRAAVVRGIGSYTCWLYSLCHCQSRQYREQVMFVLFMLFMFFCVFYVCVYVGGLTWWNTTPTMTTTHVFVRCRAAANPLRQRSESISGLDSVPMHRWDALLGSSTSSPLQVNTLHAILQFYCCYCYYM